MMGKRFDGVIRRATQKLFAPIAALRCRAIGFAREIPIFPHKKRLRAAKRDPFRRPIIVYDFALFQCWLCFQMVNRLRKKASSFWKNAVSLNRKPAVFVP